MSIAGRGGLCERVIGDKCRYASWPRARPKSAPHSTTFGGRAVLACELQLGAELGLSRGESVGYVIGQAQQSAVRNRKSLGRDWLA